MTVKYPSKPQSTISHSKKIYFKLDVLPVYTVAMKYKPSDCDLLHALQIMLYHRLMYIAFVMVNTIALHYAFGKQ